MRLLRFVIRGDSVFQFKLISGYFEKAGIVIRQFKIVDLGPGFRVNGRQSSNDCACVALRDNRLAAEVACLDAGSISQLKVVRSSEIFY